MEEPWVLLTFDGNQQSFQGRGSCPNLTKNWTGDGDIEWAFEFNPLTDQAPPGFARIEAHDDLGLIQTARLADFDLPDTKQCAGTVTYRGEGLYASLTDRKYAASRVFGYRFPDTTGVIATTAHAAVEDALNQLGGQYISGYSLPSSTVELTDSEDYVARHAQDVIASMTAQMSWLATPLVAQVRNEYFYWTALDLAARYQVSLEGSAKCKPRYDATKVYNRVIVVWGKGDQVVTYPETVIYDQLPTAVDLAVNATTEVFTIDQAQRLAEGLYNRVSTLEYGWSCTVTIPWLAGVDELGIGPISPARILTARHIRLAGLNAVSRWGAHAGRFTDVQLIKQARWNGKDKELTLDCGEIRSATDVARHQMYSGNSRMIHSLQTPGLSTPTPDNDKLQKFGPQLTEDSFASGVPSPVGFGVTAYNKETNQQLPTHSFPAPVKIIERIYTSDGAVFAAGLLETGEFYEDVPPCVLTYWSLTSALAGMIVININRAAKNADGTFQKTGSGDSEQLVAGAPVGQITLTSAKFNQASVEWRIPEEARLIYTITGSPSVLTQFTMTLTGDRIVPGFPSGLDTVPAIGAKSA